MALVYGITRHARGWPFEVPLPAGLLPQKKSVGIVCSVVLADAVRQIDYREREMWLVATCSRHVIEDVLDRLYALPRNNTAGYAAACLRVPAWIH